MRRREFIGSLCGISAAFLAPGSPAFAQAGPKRPLVVWLSAFPIPTGRNSLGFNADFLEGMNQLGYVPDRDFVFEIRTGHGPSDVGQVAEQAVAAQPAVIVVPATLEAVAVRKSTSTIPIVCPALADAVHLGLINSEARPGKNVTGVEPYIGGLPAKQIEFAREIVPGATKIGLLTNDADPKGPPQTRELQTAIAGMGIGVVSANADQPNEISSAMEQLAKEKVDIAIVLQTNLLLIRRFEIAEVALVKQLPTVFGYREHVAAGGLVSYGVDLRWCYRRGAYFVERILNGVKAGDLPIEFPTFFWLSANVGTAKSLGISLSPALLARADEVIE